MAPEYKDYYKTLGVTRSASKDEISKAYKKLAKKYHPDLNPGDKSAEEKFKDITEAYEVLKDDEKRKLYDQLGPDWQNASQFGGFGRGGAQGNPFGNGTRFTFNGQRMDGRGFSDFFETLFGGGRFEGAQFGGQDPFGGFAGNQPQRGRDIEAEIEIPLEAAVKGGERQISLQESSGQVRTLKVNIPAGIKEGARLRLGGQGHPGGRGVPNGDLFLKVRFARHPLFAVEGNDLVYEARVMPWIAALGGRIRVPTLDGEVEIGIPAGSSSGRKLRLRGKGLGTAAGRGDLLVRIGIDSPQRLSDRERQLWQELASLNDRGGKE